MHDMGRYPWDQAGSQPWADLVEVYLALARAGRLKTRIIAFLTLATWCAERPAPNCMPTIYARGGTHLTQSCTRVHVLCVRIFLCAFLL